MANVRILTHGGAGSIAADRDGTLRAAKAALGAASEGSSLEEAVLSAMDILEDDPRFNAGTGSSLRADGNSIQMDAAFMAWHPTPDSNPPTFGAVACIERVRNPTRVAFSLAQRGCSVLCGPGATRFARKHGHGDHDPMTTHAKQRYEALTRSSDTVGCVVSDGRGYAAALSSGGLTGSAIGRVGDVALPGCGLYAGPKGAVAFTGIGEEILRRSSAIRAYDRLASGVPAPEVLREIGEWFGEVEFGCILLGTDAHAAGSNRDMAWSFLERLA
jgi:isoaspartyl peptidase/L-asparaginase-like protein (Ntn-hydrolase superfamily)